MISKTSVSAIVMSCAFGVIVMTWNAGKPTQAEDPEKKTLPKKNVVTQTFMRVKLTQAQRILEGLTVEDFGEIETNATHLFLLTKAEKWNVSKDPQFIQHSNEFARLANKLAKYAREKNLDGASVTYVQITLSCIECHRFLRDEAIRISE